MTTVLPYSRQSVTEEDIQAVIEVLRSDWLTTGPVVDQFERALSWEALGRRAIGIDLLDEMVERAGANAREAGVDAWTEFRRGEMEEIPLPDESVDVVISNGVINLSPRKSRVLAETHRVLKPGGRLCVADLTVEEDLPPEILTSDSAWAG